jgi:hypothetical protein
MRRLKQELWPHKITLKEDESDPRLYLIEAWLEQNMGYITDRWYVVWSPNKSEFYFKDSKDATVFALMWS